VASAFGFLLPILLFCRQSLSIRSKRIFWGMMACTAVIAWYGVWVETRIFGELSLVFALLLTEVAEARLFLTPSDNQEDQSPQIPQLGW
jgi:hypothetical protein